MKALRKGERGGFAIGLIVGLLLGLALALGVAVYITKAPVPFVDKVPHRTAEQDSAEATRNKGWDPNAPLAPKQPPRPASASASAPAPAPEAAAAAPTRAARDPAAILSGQPAAAQAAQAAQAAPAAAPPAASAPARPAKTTADPFVYLVQAGAYSRPEEAEAQRVRLAIVGLEARVSEREQSGRTMYRVRVGPFDVRADADATQAKLQAAGVEGQLVRIERP